MTIELNLMNLIVLAIAGTSAVWALMKIIAKQAQKVINARFDLHEEKDKLNHSALDKRLDNIEAANRAEASQWQRVERELLTLKAELPIHYVRREDYIRGQSVLEAKLDGLGSKLENAQLRSLKTPD